MRVLLINAIYGSKSSGKSLAEIKQTLEKDGNTVFVATPNYIEGKSYYRIGNKYDHKLHAFLSRALGLQAYFSCISTYRLLKHIEKIKPDVIHIQVIHGNFINFGMFMKFISKKNIPTVFVLDDCWYFTGKCCHYTADKCYKWKTGCHNCVRKKADNESWFFDFSKKMYADKKRYFGALKNYAVVAVSDWLKNEAEQSYLKSANVLTRIYNSIDTEVFKPSDNASELKQQMNLQDCKVILGVATVWKDTAKLSKGIDLFIELAAMLPDDYKIILIGKMDPEIKLPDNIISIDFVEGQEKLAQYYSMADVFVQMSSEETFGKVTAEALCCGTPVIVFDSTANPELVGEGCGYVVENKNTEQVYEKIIEIINNGKQSYSMKCRDFAVQNFKSTNNTNLYIDLYKKLINQSEEP